MTDSGAERPGAQAPASLVTKLQAPIGQDLLERALMHRSYAYENGGLPTNERLEFLGRFRARAHRHRHPVPLVP